MNDTNNKSTKFSFGAPSKGLSLQQNHAPIGCNEGIKNQ